MKILVSDAYLKWRKTNKNARAADVIDKFLYRVFKATDVAQILPQPKSVGNNLRKTPGVANEFTLNKQFRVYSKYVELTPGNAYFCLATVGIKGNTNQHEDILTALSIFDNVTTEQWEEWQPSAEQINASLSDDAKIADNENSDVTPTPEEVKQPVKKNKGKPLDENGLTVAERKALRKKQQQEELQKRRADEQKRKAEEQKRLDKEQKAKELEENKDNINMTDEQMTTKPVLNTTESEPVQHTDMPAATDQPAAEQELRTEETNTAKQEFETNIMQQKPIISNIGDIEFKDFADVQYNLELIDLQMAIEKLKVEINQHKIALKELEIKKLQLLHAQKTKNWQK